MAKKIEMVLSSKKQVIISIPVSSSNYKSELKIFYYEGAKNNFPDANAKNTAKAIRDLLIGLGRDDLLLVLLSEEKSNIKDLTQNLETFCIPRIDVSILKNIKSIEKKDLCLILGGEITVEVKGAGKGGTNQELALKFSNFVGQANNNFAKFDIHFLSAGTDGTDGPPDLEGYRISKSCDRGETKTKKKSPT
ncbi:unnamed protein product [Arctia plantaginis]|uniref:MOFRL-associated domain-containing protein n=1 Tax=Arctia plantaginis TaxID=874455 RepID=A0A8S1AH56_ARCPL|nr:unnamed protein product [Arctia plantaginis]